MKGLRLSSLRQELHKVSPRFEKRPAQTIKQVVHRLDPHWREWLTEEWGGTRPQFFERYHSLPLKAFKNFSFDELAKLYYSAKSQMQTSVREFFGTRAEYEVVRRIISSLRRWGWTDGTWNEIVDAHNCLRHFSFLTNPNFEVRLDYTPDDQRWGYSKFSQVYLDGSLAFLVYYKREHVMTIGFSFVGGRRILIQQIQLVKPSGNRWLYQLPANRLEFVIDLFRRNFKDYGLYVIDGEALVDKLLGEYRTSIERIKRFLDDERRAFRPSAIFSEDFLQKEAARCEELKRKEAHLRADKPRLVAFYANTSQFAPGTEPYTTNGLPHHAVVP